MRSRMIAMCLGVVLSVAQVADAAEPVTTASLLEQMTDLRQLAEHPEPAFTCRQFSSYDRVSITPDNHDDWFANADWGKFIRVEQRDGRSEHVMVDVAGPGALVRIWSANPKGTLRIYLDGAEQPIVAARMEDLLGGKVPGFPEPLAGRRSAGWNLYFPIPYAKHCKITCDHGGFYYHVNYRTYDSGTRVRTFTPQDLAENAEVIKQVARALLQPTQGDRAHARLVREIRAQVAAERGVTEIKGGDAKDVARLDRPGCIEEICVKLDAKDLARGLRQTVLGMEFDGACTVACPLGDFFGAGPGVQPYASLPLGVEADGVMWSRWVMPFAQGARIWLENLGTQPVRVVFGIRQSDYAWTSCSQHFGAGWRVEREVPSRPFIDWNYVDIDGRGVFVGAAFAIANPVRNWWGEGDEKIYVDGEKFPSHFGTGTEDYFGYAWCSPEQFTHAYHNQPRCDGPQNYGHTAVNRWHVLDRIPFESSFRFDMEFWHQHSATKALEMSVATYWYARPGAESNRGKPTAEDVRLVVIPPYVAPKVEGAIEGEEMEIMAKTGTPAPQHISGCSGDRHLWWRGAEPGEELDLVFEAQEDGPHRIYARFVKAADYGRVQLALNGEALGEPLDLYNDGVVVSEEKLLGQARLRGGRNTLTIRIVGANEQAVKKYMAGFDYLRLERVDQ